MFIRKFDEVELCSITIDNRCNSERVALLLKALSLPVIALTSDANNKGYWMIPTKLKERVMKGFHWDSAHDTLFKSEIRWYEA